MLSSGRSAGRVPDRPPVQLVRLARREIAIAAAAARSAASNASARLPGPLELQRQERIRAEVAAGGRDLGDPRVEPAALRLRDPGVDRIADQRVPESSTGRSSPTAARKK